MASSQPAQTQQPAQMGQMSQAPSQASSQMTAQIPAAPRKPIFTDFASI
ncbi:hypothetical protein [Yoonia vestfoldensis]|uniref:Uncharacterized protein n=1 Tax=Yoonia vestfoldensis TaxID=245188 RepID=A0A1Y0EBD0_9RHOB|nr:hypothetical protein [Yoonia vestfoldensis]ARU00926.1 hypothetical protein LOKVESSMR4R_01611 [Yoonia vestfoldensis]